MKPHFNLLAGTIKEVLASGRFYVVLEQGLQELSLKQLNLEPLRDDAISDLMQKCRDLIWNLSQLHPSANLDALIPTMMVHPRCDFVEQKVGVDGGGSGGNGASGTACEACKRIFNAILSGYQAMQENQKFLGSMTEPPRGYLAQAVPYEIGAVLAALRLYSSPVVVVAACRWLGKAAFYDNHQGAGDDIQQMGAHAAVVAALARHGESVSV